MVMTIRLHIVPLDWDHWNQEHIRKHDVTREEVEEVVGSIPIFRESYRNRFLMIGLTAAGRPLAVAIGPSPNRPGAYYVFSARTAHRKERRDLQEERES
jgi:uncharacterized DUF497 family protein